MPTTGNTIGFFFYSKKHLINSYELRYNSWTKTGRWEQNIPTVIFWKALVHWHWRFQTPLWLTLICFLTCKFIHIRCCNEWNILDWIQNLRPVLHAQQSFQCMSLVVGNGPLGVVCSFHRDRELSACLHPQFPKSQSLDHCYLLQAKSISLFLLRPTS